MTIKTMSYKTTKKDYTLILKITSHNQIVTIITLSVLDVVHFRNAKALTLYSVQQFIAMFRRSWPGPCS